MSEKSQGMLNGYCVATLYTYSHCMHSRIAIIYIGEMSGLGRQFEVCDIIWLCIVKLTKINCIGKSKFQAKLSPNFSWSK